MRILFSFVGGSGHADPLVPIARAAREAGHGVLFTGRPAPLARIASLGFDVLPTPGDTDASTELKPLLEPSQEREDRVVREGFARGLPQLRAGAVEAICSERGIDLVVSDELDFGAKLAAERLGLPHATVLVSASGSFLRPELIAEPLNELRVELGLPPDPELASLCRHLVLSAFPASFRDPAGATCYRAFTPVSPRPQEPPLVYFTLGTVFNLESGDLFERVLAGLAELPVDVVVTVGPQRDPAELGPLPANLTAARHVDHAELLPRCGAVVSHGGSGTLLAALAHGLPSVLLPLGADQLLNAARAEELGVARVLDVVRAAPDDVRAATAEVLADPGYRTRAGRLRDELAALPGPEHAARLLERLYA